MAVAARLHFGPKSMKGMGSVSHADSTTNIFRTKENRQ